MHRELTKKKFNTCRVGRPLGIEIIRVDEGYAEAKMVIREEHMNPFGAVHGGIIFTFADHVGGACGNSLGKQAVLLESSIQFLKPVFPGETIHGTAIMVHRGKKIDRIEVRIFKDNGENVALTHMISFVLDDG